MAAPKTAVLLLCLVAVPTAIIAQTDIAVDADKHCSQPKPAPLPEKLKETKPAPTGPGSPPPVSADVTGEGFGNICGIASLPKAICVLEKAGPCCEKKGGCKDEITVSGPIKLDKKATVNGKAVTPFEVDENFDTTFKVATPKGFKSEIRVYLTSSVSFSCPTNGQCQGGTLIPKPINGSAADICGGPSCITTTISLAAVNCLHPCGDCEDKLKPTTGSVPEDLQHPPFAPSPPPPDVESPIIDISPIDASPVIVKPGDVNEDGLVNIQDTVYISGAILGTGPVLSDTAFFAADLNSDGDVSVMDEVLGIDMILGN